MKIASLTAILVLVFLVFGTSPSFAQYYQNSSSTSTAAGPQYTSPNYWGDARVKNRSTAANNSQSGSSPPMSGGRSGGGGGMSPFMFMGPAMMLPAMMRSTLGRGIHPNHRNRQPEEDNDQKQSKRKKSKKFAQQPSVNDENNLPDPLVPMNSALSKKTFDLQNGNGMPRPEEQQMRVRGVVQDEEVSAQMEAPLQSRDFAPAQVQAPIQTPVQGSSGAQSQAELPVQAETPMQAQVPAAGVDLQGVDF